MTSLGEKIAKLTNPTPEVLDPEDDINYESAQITYSEDLKDTGDNEISDLRRRTAPLLEDIDPTYSGKKVSRQALGHIFRKEDSFADEAGASAKDSLTGSENSEEDSEGDVSESDLKSFKEFVAQQSNDSDEEQGKEDEDESLSDEEEEDEEEEMTEQFSNFDVTSEIEKGQAIKNQKEIWNRLMESRIKLQKLLVLVNKLPQGPSWNTVKDKGGKEMTESLNQASQSVKNILNSCVTLQTALVGQNKELSSTNSKEKENIVNDSEEIASDTDEEMEDFELEESRPKENSKKRKLNMEELDDILGKRFKSLEPYRNAVIQKWDEKTRLATGRMTQKSFRGFDNSALKQIEQILQDKTRLVRRTQLKRSLYRVLGKPECSEIPSEDIEAQSSVSKQDLLLKDYDPEIFDDDDFYRQILKDIIESKSFGIDPAVIRKQMEIQKIRNKMKRKVDTKASKGRRLRYDVHPKLVNFMAPRQISQMGDEARDSFLKHLFGGKSSS